MKSFYKINYTALVVFITCFTFCACEKNDADTIAPGKVSNVSFRPTNGGAVLKFDIPNDDDLLFIKAVYVNALGKEVFKVSSHYGDSIEIDGFVDETPQKVRLYAVDRSNNVSEPTELNVVPHKSFIFNVQESVVMSEQLGGVRVSWKNPEQKTVFVYVHFTKDGRIYERILTSPFSEPSIVIRGLDPVQYSFSVTVEDFNGNKTGIEPKGTFQPLLEQKIDKSPWRVIQNMSVDGDKWEGSLAAFFDDKVDTKESNADNSYFIISRDDNGGMLKWPLNIVIDLNKTVVINRFVVWQRAFEYINAEQNGVSQNYYYYKQENMRSFTVSVSMDKITWIPLGNFDIGDPRDEAGNILPAKIKEAINGHEFNLESISPQFRYLKFGILSNYGSETNVYGSEITLYGRDNLQ